MTVLLFFFLFFFSFHFSNRKQCITSESQFDFLKELVESIPDLPTNEEEVDDIDEPKPKRYERWKGKDFRFTLCHFLCCFFKEICSPFPNFMSSLSEKRQLYHEKTKFQEKKGKGKKKKLNQTLMLTHSQR